MEKEMIKEVFERVVRIETKIDECSRVLENDVKEDKKTKVFGWSGFEIFIVVLGIISWILVMNQF